MGGGGAENEENKERGYTRVDRRSGSNDSGKRVRMRSKSRERGGGLGGGIEAEVVGEDMS